MRLNPLFVVLVASLLIGSLVTADDKADRERKVRVALALATPVAPEQCGKCREDVDAARADALRENRPLVLFVGGCPGVEWSTAAEAAGAIPAKVTEYKSDDRPAAEKRAVILEPKKDKSGFVIADTLPAGSTPAEVRAAVRKSQPKKVAALNWEF